MVLIGVYQFRVLRQKGTERPGSHPYDHSNDKGVYRELWAYLLVCQGCLIIVR